MEKNKNIDIKTAHKLGKLAIFIVYGKKKVFCDPFLYISFFIGIGILTFSIITATDLLEIIKSLVDIFLSVIPSIVGITLAGYALIISLGNSEFMKKASRPQRDGYSYYQKTSAGFAMIILVQTLVLLTCIFLKIGIPISVKMPVGIFYASLVNSIVILFVSILGIYSIFLIIDTVSSVFNYGQSVHFLIRLEDEKEKKAKATIQKPNDPVLPNQ